MDRHPLDLQPQWCCAGPESGRRAALSDPWGGRHRPDWAARGLIIWPRGGVERILWLRTLCPEPWRALGPAVAYARLVLRWWADAAELRVDGRPVLAGDLFDTACRWPLPERWWAGEPLELELRLRSPLHDDGALIHSRIELEPRDPADPHNLLAPTRQRLRALRADRDPSGAPADGRVRVLGHAHLDLAWLWPVADTWQAAERTFRSTLALMERFPELHFGHSTPALYAWLEQQRPALFAAIRAAMRAGRWEPLNGPWVETDCVLVGTASLLRQFQEGQQYSRRTFPEWSHRLAWLPDSFGFAAGLPAVAAATDVRWFCTHKLAWNASHPFPHRLFRWRSPCGAELLALMTAPIGTDGDPLAIEEERLAWQSATGTAELLWLPGVGDHGGGPTAAMLEQLALWSTQPEAAPQSHGTLRQHLESLEPLAASLPVWRDELYLELHRGCATSRPDQKRHNRTLERLLREAELAIALAPAAGVSPATAPNGVDPAAPVDWRPLLFQQFHDILPGTSIPEVFEQAEPQWRAARRRACRQRDGALQRLAAACLGVPAADGSWWLAQLQPLPPAPRLLRLPAGRWGLAGPGDGPPQPLPGQPAAGGGQWLQLPPLAGVALRRLERLPQPVGAGAAASVPAALPEPFDPVRVRPDPEAEAGGAGAPRRWRLENGQLAVRIGPEGVEQLWDSDGRPCLAAPLAWRRWADRGEFWDAWDLAADHRAHPLPWSWEGEPLWRETGPLCARFLWRGRCGASRLWLEGRLQAGSPCLELRLGVDWRQRHELLRLELPLARPALRWAADTPGGVIERPAAALLGREQARWEVAAVSWLASVAAGGGGLAVLLDGPQGVSGDPERLGVSLLRAPTWPDPGADNGWQRQHLALMPCPRGWRPDGVVAAAQRLREPLWCRPVRPMAGAAASLRERPLLPLLPPLPDDLQLLSLRREPQPQAANALLLAVQNLGPRRRRLELPPGWRLLARVDGLGQPLASPLRALPADGAGHPLADPRLVRPWQLAFWRLLPPDQSS
ncbi:MAG: glycoside hydrolase family 38 C-terminal domain-containing protein [Synechococcaceae cyanobacterium]|nr:glycoside hydrolase family 38 C-terminal domain-containing protein [Synechococcaceae cyanobacterium]